MPLSSTADDSPIHVLGLSSVFRNDLFDFAGLVKCKVRSVAHRYAGMGYER